MINKKKLKIKHNTVNIDIRAHYGDPTEVFDVKDLASKDPVAQFDSWFQLARKNPGIKEPNAMCLSTCTL